MGKYDEFDLDIKEVKANSSKGTARSTWGCVEKSIEIKAAFVASSFQIYSQVLQSAARTIIHLWCIGTKNINS